MMQILVKGDDARSQWVKRQRLSRLVKADTGVNELNMITCNQSVAAVFLLYQKETERDLDTSRTSQLLGRPGYKGAITRRVRKASGIKGQIFKEFVSHKSLKYTIYMTIHKTRELNIIKIRTSILCKD